MSTRAARKTIYGFGFLAILASSTILAGNQAFADGEADASRATHQRYEGLRSAHAEDALDKPWATKKSSAISSRMSALRLAADLRIDCRSEYCWVDGKWPTKDAQETMTQDLAHAWMRDEPCEFHLFDMSAIDPATPDRFVVVVHCEG